MSHVHQSSSRRPDARWRFRSSHPLGLRPAAIPLVIVTGSAAAGKSFYVYSRCGEGDVVIDLDEIARDLVLGI